MVARGHDGDGSGTVALLGGAGLLAWLLLRKGGAGTSTTADAAGVTQARRSVVRILPGDRLEIDGELADLSAVIARCRATGAAEVHARGDARQGFVVSVITALSATAIKLYVAPDLVTMVPGLHPRNIGPTGTTPFRAFDNVETFDDLFIAQLRYLAEQRGFDRMAPEPGMTGGNRLIPRSTNADVIALADYWTVQLRRVKRVFGAAGVEQRWNGMLAQVDALARKGDPSAVYRSNNTFWRALQQVAIHVAAADEAPSKADLMLDALKGSVLALPDNIVAGVKAGASAVSDAATGVAHGAGSVAHGAGNLVGSAARGLFGGLFGWLGLPVLVGGGGLAAIFLLARNRRKEG